MRVLSVVGPFAIVWLAFGCGSAAQPVPTLASAQGPGPGYGGGPAYGPGPGGAGPAVAGQAAPGSDAAAEQLLNATLMALQQNRDEEAAARAVLPYLHRSLMDATGANLTTDVRQFSFKKAFGAAPLYASPVKVTRVRPNNVTEIGFGPTAERGRSVDYFVAKRDGQPGMPAPVTVFFPASGGPPKVTYLGSL